MEKPKKPISKKSKQISLDNPNHPDYWDYMRDVGIEAIREQKTGRPNKIESPEELWEYACEYFKEVDSTPYEREDFIKAGPTAGQKVRLKQIRPYTWTGLENYLFKKKIIATLEDYRYNRNGAYDAFSRIIARINNTMYDQKFTGATVGAFKENIIARDLKLTDSNDVSINPSSKIEVTVTRKK